MNNYIFPLPFPAHLTFVIIGFLFFALMYARKKYVYHLLLAIAIPSTMLVYACQGSKLFYYLLGIEELILIVLIFVFIAVQKRKLAKKEDENKKVTVNKTPSVSQEKDDDDDFDDDFDDDQSK